jgi:hypothetical protein
MKKIYKLAMKAMGGKPNGTPETSCVNDASHIKQILMLLGLAFSAGAFSIGFKGLPTRVLAVEEKVIKIESISQSIDDRLARIETALIRRRP